MGAVAERRRETDALAVLLGCSSRDKEGTAAVAEKGAVAESDRDCDEERLLAAVPVNASTCDRVADAKDEEKELKALPVTIMCVEERLCSREWLWEGSTDRDGVGDPPLVLLVNRENVCVEDQTTLDVGVVGGLLVAVPQRNEEALMSTRAP